MLDQQIENRESRIENRASRIKYRNILEKNGFALYEVLLGVAIFAIGVLALGRAVENCLNATTINAEENRVRQILANRMAEIQTSPGHPDAEKETKVDSGYGQVTLIQKTGSAKLQDENGADLTGIDLVTLIAKWSRAGSDQSRQLQFYVYRPAG
jgi:Tfp pilus assembly protein PilV